MSDQESTPPTEPTKPTRKRNRGKPAIKRAVRAPAEKLAANHPQAAMPVDDQTGQPKPSGNGNLTLAPDLSKHRKAVFHGKWWWIGALPTLRNLEGATVAGLSFKRDIYKVTVGINGKTDRERLSGATHKLTRQKIELIAERVSHTMVRWRGGSGNESDVLASGGVEGQTLEDVGEAKGNKGRSAQLIRIPSDVDVKKGAEHNRPPRPYVMQAGDEPLMNYLYCVPCAGPNARGLELPAPLSETGLAWPKD
jgi:hypothetical protein